MPIFLREKGGFLTDYTQLYLTIVNLFCLIFVGFLSRKFEIVDENTTIGLNKLISNVLFPVKIMMSFHNIEFRGDLSLKYLVYLNVMLLFHILLTFCFSRITNEDRSIAVLEANGISRGNFIVMSLPILSVLFGDKGTVMAGVITSISQFFYNFYTASMYENLVGENNSNKTLLISVLKTPLIIGLFIGIFLYVTKISIFFLEISLRGLGDTAGTLALVTIGYGSDFRIDFKEIKSILKVSTAKLLVLPLIGLLVGKIFGLPEIQKAVALILFGAPTAVSTYVLAKRCHQGNSLAGCYAVNTTILYLLTLLLLTKLI